MLTMTHHWSRCASRERRPRRNLQMRPPMRVPQVRRLPRRFHVRNLLQ